LDAIIAVRGVRPLLYWLSNRVLASEPHIINHRCDA
jgi:hypothetical protein